MSDIWKRVILSTLTSPLNSPGITLESSGILAKGAKHLDTWSSYLQMQVRNFTPVLSFHTLPTYVASMTFKPFEALLMPPFAKFAMHKAYWLMTENGNTV